MRSTPDIVIVGAGIAGASLALVLARKGVPVALVEREAQHADRVRGEFIVPWGVEEAARLDLLGVMRAAGARPVRRVLAGGEALSMDGADARVLTPAEAQGGLPQPLCISHSAVCEALCRAAERAGATVLYGAQNLCVAAGVPPMLSCRIDGKVTEWRPRLVVGADGRESSVRRKLGFVVKSDPPHHLVGGMLVDGVPEWRQDAWAFGTEGQLNFMVLPQGGRRLRLYAAWASELNERFAGPDRRRRLLQAFGALRSLRQAQAIARASPIGPFNAFANEDRWVDDPVLPGVVLVGDAAGTNDPVIAQGLAVALRDVRLVSDAILQGSDAPQALACYAKERWERMRRLRVAGRLAAKLHVEFGPAAQDRRLRVLQALPEGHVLSPLSAVHLGPDRVPAEAFGVAALERLLLV